MAREPNEILEQQRRQRLEQQQATRGTMETVNLEQRQAQNQVSKYQHIVINILAVIGALALIYIILSIIF